MSEAKVKNPVARAIKAILIVQLGMAVFLFGRDMVGSWPTLGFGPRAPSLDAPVRPGDQTRRFDPRDLPQRDIPESRPFPATPNMPDRLAFEIVETEEGKVLTLTTIEMADKSTVRFDVGLGAPVNLWLRTGLPTYPAKASWIFSYTT